MREDVNEEARKLINEAGSIGEEQLPAVDTPKNDKQEWSYAADENFDDSTWWGRVKKFFRGGT